MLAYYFDEIPSLVGLPPELTMSVLEMLPPLKLGQAEQTPKLTELGIGTVLYCWLKFMFLCSQFAFRHKCTVAASL